jgi:hypothetical protein
MKLKAGGGKNVRMVSRGEERRGEERGGGRGLRLEEKRSCCDDLLLLCL